VQAIANTYAMLLPGALWCVIDTPNRLWHFDSSSARRPFLHWLPDDLAATYALWNRHQTATDQPHEEDVDPVDFARWGRGISYHELDLGIGPADQLDVAGYMGAHIRDQNPLRRALHRCTNTARFARLLRAFADRPLSPAFFEPYLNLAIRRA